MCIRDSINAFGAQAMAGCGAYSKLEGFAFLPVTCFSMALATFVSQNVGAGRPDRVRSSMRFGLAASCLLAEGIGVGMFALAPQLIGLFNSEPGVIAFGVQQARTVALFYCLLAFSHCCAGILRGLGRPVVPMAIMLLSLIHISARSAGDRHRSDVGVDALVPVEEALAVDGLAHFQGFHGLIDFALAVDVYKRQTPTQKENHLV